MVLSPAAIFLYLIAKLQFMKKLFTLILILLTIALQYSCKKDDNGTPAAKRNLKSITSSGQSIISYTYDNDDRIVQSKFNYGSGIIITSDYNYVNGKLSTIKPDLHVVPYKRYEYDNNGVLTSISIFETYPDNKKLYRKFELTYNAQGKLSKKVELDADLIRIMNVLTFQYNADGLLSKIHVVSNEFNKTGDITIENYSDECNFDSYAVIDFVAFSDYFSPELFIDAKRLPVKFNYLFDDGTKLNRENVFVIKNKQLISFASATTETFKYNGELRTTEYNWSYNFNY